jgi:hypothetical protein
VSASQPGGPRDPGARGRGSRADLPVPLFLALYAPGLAVVVSFLGPRAALAQPKLRGDAAGRPLPGLVQAVVDSPVVRWLARLVVLALTLLVVAVALVGPASPNDNLAPYVLYVTLWVGLIPASLLLGRSGGTSTRCGRCTPGWRRSPGRRRRRGGSRRSATGPRPSHCSASCGWSWCCRAGPSRGPSASSSSSTASCSWSPAVVRQRVVRPRRRVRGLQHPARADVAVRPAGGRPPRPALAARRRRRAAPERGLTAVVMVLIGSTGFDGLSRTQYWAEGPGGTPT